MSTGTTTPSVVRIWLMAARPKTLPVGLAPVLVGTALADTAGVFHALRFVAALLGRALHPGRREPLERLLRRAPRRGRRGPARPCAGDGRRARAAAAGADRDVRDVRARDPHRGYLIAVAGWQLLLVGAASIVAGVLYTGGPRPYGYEGLGELFVFLFFGIVAVAGSFFVQTETSCGRRSRWPCRSDCSPPPCSSSTTSATWRPTDAPASERWRCVWAANARAICTRRWSTARSCSRRSPGSSARSTRGCCFPSWPFRSRRRSCGRRDRTDGPSLNEALARTGQLELLFCVLLSAGILLS